MQFGWKKFRKITALISVAASLMAVTASTLHSLSHHQHEVLTAQEGATYDSTESAAALSHSPHACLLCQFSQTPFHPAPTTTAQMPQRTRALSQLSQEVFSPTVRIKAFHATAPPCT